MVSTCLSVAFSLAPLLPALHVTFASHDHRYCVEHHQTEDVTRSEAYSWVGLQELRSGAQAEKALRVFDTPRRTSGHIACAIASHSPSRDPLVLTEEIDCFCAPRLTHHALTQNEDVPGPIPLFLAPKTSPPATLFAVV